ncbi:MAG: helix-turn-helix transcriptional regulator [Anaerotignum sp.]|nr:helix-turn-helix transcriptional regulator [Anaerotignum sp.]MBR3992380.1 helix-turn-helix transcriptional regulator [Anaerotignum sp.]
MRLKNLREERKISQQKLAIELNVSQASISKYEKGLAEPDIPMLCTIAEFFHVSVDYLIGRTSTRNNLSAIPLNDREQALLQHFNALTENQKEKVEMYILGLLDL